MKRIDRTLLTWPHTGFGVHVGGVVFPHAEEEEENDRPQGVKGLLEYAEDTHPSLPEPQRP